MVAFPLGWFTTERVVATSPGYEIVAHRVSAGWLTDHRLLLRLRSRDGLASRESGDNLACFLDNERDEPPQSWFLDRAEFVTGHAVRLHAANGFTWEVPFDPGTLAPGRLVDQCAVAAQLGAD